MKHVAVVGAGIIGAAIVDRLTQVGVRVTSVDTSAYGSGTSINSLAWINSNRKPPRSYHDFSTKAMIEWNRLADEFGQPNWYVPTGSISWATTDERRRELAERIARLRDWGYRAEEISAAQVADLEPRLMVPPNATIGYFSTEGFVHTRPAITALLARAQARGAHIVASEKPVRFESDGARVTAVKLPNGERIHADVYVCCTGWRTAQLLGPLGITVPIVAGDAPGSEAPCFVARMYGAPTPIERVINAPRLTLGPIWPNGVQLEANDINAVVDYHTERHKLEQYSHALIDRATEIVSTIGVPTSTEAVVCVRPLPTDGKPVVGWLSELPNTYLVVSHSGVTLAPLLARLVTSDLLDGPNNELDPYRINRFAN